MNVRVSEHFLLDDFLPDGIKAEDAPHEVVANVTMLVTSLLEPLRDGLATAVIIHDGWRPPKENEAVGGVRLSDHLVGAAADFHAAATAEKPWEEMTLSAFDWLRRHRAGDFGQLILEDHRAHYGVPGKLWVHVSLRSAKHDGTTTDPSRLLVSSAPRQYQPWVDVRFA